ncbi:hypothetical protein M3Y98_00871800 [Aphelenchoides besseyi]|nr:hypothetical protein M3Y98_00871800 [Aphelenchoides besseyi]KAI6211292.1 hypothetical protein M3Y96_00418100 [Aphelenchoides besseyi]
MPDIYVINPKFPSVGVYVFCICVHLIVGIYGSVQGCWWPVAYGFLMCIVYVIAIIFAFLRLNLLRILVAIVEAILLLLLFVFFILAIYMAAAQPVEGIDIVYDLFPQDGNFVETYNTLAIAIVICALILLFVNTLGFLSTVYSIFHARQETQVLVVTRA